MKNEEIEFTISVFSENEVGLLSRVVAVFSRRYIDIVSLNTSESSNKDIFRFTIVVIMTEEMVKKICAQIEKQIYVIKAFYHERKDIVFQEMALYKVPTSIFMNSDKIENLVRFHNARILSIEPEYIVIEKTGHEDETTALLEALKKEGIYEFVRSGRVSITKPMEQLNNYLSKLEKAKYTS